MYEVNQQRLAPQQVKAAECRAVLHSCQKSSCWIQGQLTVRSAEPQGYPRRGRRRSPNRTVKLVAQPSGRNPPWGGEARMSAGTYRTPSMWAPKPSGEWVLLGAIIIWAWMLIGLHYILWLVNPGTAGFHLCPLGHLSQESLGSFFVAAVLIQSMESAFTSWSTDFSGDN